MCVSRCRLCFSLCLLIGASTFATAADWPQWRGPDRNGRVNSEIRLTAKTSFQQKWKKDIGIGFSSIVIAAGRVYTSGSVNNQDVIWCLNSPNGEVLWKHAYDSPLDPKLFEGGPTATPTVSGERVYTISRRGEIYSLDAATGEVHWQFSNAAKLKANVPDWGFGGSPLVVGEGVIFNVGSHGLCLNAHTGAIRWQSDNSDNAGYSSPLSVTVNGVQLVLLFSGKALNAVDPESGTVLWKFPWLTRYGVNAADPLLVDETRLLVSSGYGKGAALLKFDAKQAESSKRIRELRIQMSPGVVINGHVYAVDGDTVDADRKLVCLNVSSGKVKWSQAGCGSATVIAVNDKLLILTDSGELMLANANPLKIEILNRGKILAGKCWTHPAFAEGMVYARNASGNLVCIQIKN